MRVLDIGIAFVGIIEGLEREAAPLAASFSVCGCGSTSMVLAGYKMHFATEVESRLDHLGKIYYIVSVLLACFTNELLTGRSRSCGKDRLSDLDPPYASNGFSVATARDPRTCLLLFTAH